MSSPKASGLPLQGHIKVMVRLQMTIRRHGIELIDVARVVRFNTAAQMASKRGLRVHLFGRSLQGCVVRGCHVAGRLSPDGPRVFRWQACRRISVAFPTQWAARPLGHLRVTEVGAFARGLHGRPPVVGAGLLQHPWCVDPISFVHPFADCLFGRAVNDAPAHFSEDPCSLVEVK